MFDLTPLAPAEAKMKTYKYYIVYYSARGREPGIWTSCQISLQHPLNSLDRINDVSNSVSREEHTPCIIVNFVLMADDDARGGDSAH